MSAATVLQRKGYKTCIIDSQVFPREKLCAGVLTVKSIRLLQYIYKDLNLENLNIKHINKIVLLNNRETIGKYTLANPYSVINRTEFDNALLQYYKNIGGLVFDGQKNYTIAYDKNLVKLSDGNEITYRFLIGADGINSKVRANRWQGWKASILCFEKFIPNTTNEDTIKINFGGMLGGYSWRIPGQDRIGIGLGEFYIKGMKRKPDKYRKYFNAQGVTDINGMKGAFVSFGNFVPNPVKQNILLAGDAAGLVDAMTGEGIYFAIESGRQAALAIIELLEKGTPLSTYTNRIKRIHKKIKEQSIYNKMLYVPILQLISLQHIKKNPEFGQSVLENAVSTYHTGYTKELQQNKRKKRQSSPI
ncbi:MAG: tryptophan 7-halogenase [Lachnospiraceae bacterium]|nr:tryptophan 7-halogenase [Lachnospiraceae bacterium]